MTFSEQPPVYSRPKEAVPPTPLPYPAAAAGPYGGVPAVPPTAQPPPPYPPAAGYPPYPVSGGGGGPSFRSPYPPASGAGAAAYPAYGTPYPPAPGASYQTQVSGSPCGGEICPFRFLAPRLIEYDSVHCFDGSKYFPFYISYLPVPNVRVAVPDPVLIRDYFVVPRVRFMFFSVFCA